MALTLLDRDDENVDLVSLLEEDSCHYVSVAMPGLTVASHCVEFAGGFSTEQRNDFMATVNQAQETGTLFPHVNVTLLPSPSASYTGFDSRTYNDGDYEKEEVVQHMLDAFEANIQHVRSRTMYFDFRDLCVSENHYVSCLEATLQEIDVQDEVRVFTWNPKE